MAKRNIDLKINQLKEEMCECFVEYLEKEGLTQKKLAKKMKLNEALLSKITRHQYQEFSLDRLIKLLNYIRPDLVLILQKTRKRK